MNDRGLVEVPENAIRDEPVAFGLTGIQLGIGAAAVLAAMALNLMPVWDPLRLVLIVVGAGPICLAAVLPIRGEPAYRWFARWVRHRRGPRVWHAVLISPGKAPDKPEVSGAAYDPGRARGVNEVTDRPFDQLPVETGMGDDSVPELGSAQRAPERAEMEEQQPRLRLLPGRSGDDPTERPDRPDEQPSSPVPHLLGGLRVVCFMSFAGGVGKTTLAVEAASLVSSRARYQTLDAEERPLRVLLLDAARTSPVAALRLGIDPDAVSRLNTRYDWPDSLSFEQRAVETRHGVTLLTLPQLPMQGLGPDLPFGAIEAAAVLDAAEHAGFQLVVVDLGSSLEEGHRHLMSQAASVLGVVTPRVEALPDVYRITSYVRAMGAGRKLGLIANQATEPGSLPALADEEQVPIVATVPRLGAFDTAGDRGVPAWSSDAEVEAVMGPVATAVWSLYRSVPSSSEHRFRVMLAGVGRLRGARDRR